MAYRAIHQYGLICVVCLVWGCDTESRSNNKSGESQLSDPIVERLGAERALKLQIEGVKKYVTSRAEIYRSHEPVVLRCRRAQRLLTDVDVFLRQSPFVLSARFIKDPAKPLIDVIGLDPGRSWDETQIWFTDGRRSFVVTFKEDKKERAEEYNVDVFLPYRRLPIDEIADLATELQSGMWTLAIEAERGLEGTKGEVLLPDDPNIQLYAALRNRDGKMSDLVPIEGEFDMSEQMK